MRSAANDPALTSEFTALAGAWLTTHRSWNTRAAYEADLAWFADWCTQRGRSPLHVTQADVEEHRADCEASGSSPASIRRRLAALSSFFDYAQSGEEAGDNPAAKVERPKTPDASTTAELDESEADALVEAAEVLGAKAAVLVTVLMHAGLKLGEVLDADVEDLSTPPPTLSIMRQGRAQLLELPPSTAAAISAYTDGRDTGPLLLSDSPTRAPGRLTRAGAHHILKRVSQHAGVTKTVSANTLRRYYATNAHAHGVHIDDIRDQLGHDDRRTTRRLLLPENPNSQH